MVERSAWLLTLRRASEAQEDELADEYDQRWGEIHPVHAEWVGRFLSLVQPVGVVLDAACGTGKFLGMVLESGREVIGVDHSAAALARAQTKHPAAATRQLDLQDLAFDDEFDGVMCVDAMEFVPPEDWPVVMAAFRRRNRRDAWLYLTVELAVDAEVAALNRELADSGLPVVEGEVLWDQPDGYYHFHPDMDRVRKWIADAGLAIVDDIEGPWTSDDDGSYAYHHVLAREEHDAMTADLPLLPTTVVGSYADPSWFYAAKELMEADRFGPTDVEETFDDAVDRAILDQEEAGLDIISDGEMRRASFVWAFASRMTGLRDAGPLRKMGPMSLDMRSVQETTGPVGVPNGMGAVEEFEYARTRTDRHIKIPLPGPFALTTFIRPVEHYRDRTHLAEAFVPALNDEIRRLAATGCKWIQLDEPATPGYASNDPHTAEDIARLFNACIEGVSGVHFSLHVCFGSFRKLPYTKKTYAHYFPDLLDAQADQFVFEFATREMAEIDQWPKWAPDRELGAGIIDIRTHYCETPDDVAEKVRRCLEYVPAEKLFLTTDCGLRYVHRTLGPWAKLTNLVSGVRTVREQLAGA